MPGPKIQILCTALIDGLLAKEIDSGDVQIDIIPFIEIIFDRSEELKRMVESIPASSYVVFTSGNAVKAVSYNSNGKLAAKLYCLADNTLKTVRACFGDIVVEGTGGNAYELAKKIMDDKKTHSVIFFCGNLRRDELPSMLRSNGIHVEEVEVYQTKTQAHRVDKIYDGILFFSPSAVQSFFQHNKIEQKTVLFAIGSTTAAEINNYSRNRVITIEEPSKNKLFKHAVEYLNNYSASNN